MSRLDAIYLNSPVWMQGAFVAAYGWWWHRRRFGREFFENAAALRAHETWTPEQFRAYQNSRLAEVFRAASRSPYYRGVLAQAGVDRDTHPREVLMRLPLLTKEQLRASPRELLTGAVPKGTVVFRSSGTTGTPTDIYYSREFHACETAVIEARNLNWAGATYRDRRVMFGARKICRFNQQKPPFWRYSPAENLAYASVYHLGPRFLPAYLHFLRTFRPKVVMGYPSALYAVAQFALDHGEPLPAPLGVFTSAERLPDHMRAAIESAWQCRVFDRYGAVEGCVSASQCEYGRYHVNPEIGIVEILDVMGRAVPPGVEGEVVCTGLQNTLQPLIRYRIGDTARWAIDQDCACRRRLPILEGIDGRVEDYCYTRDGRRVIRFDTVFKGVATIRQAQVVQETLDLFTVNVIPARGFDERDLQRIQQNMTLHVGHVAVNVRCVDEIPKTDAGKFRAVICRLSAHEKTQWSQAASVARLTTASGARH
jgi:phenylacetate-CoA ligase